MKSVFYLIGAAALLLPACTDVQAIQSPPLGELVWADEFNDDGLDITKWVAETSCWGGGNNEHQCYVDNPENIRVENGVLTLRALPKKVTDLAMPQHVSDRGELVSQDYTSGKITTRGLASWTYGRFEARIKLPQGQSTWPAFWMLPEDDAYGGWPLSGEIDIMEAVNLGTVCESCPSGTENRTLGAIHYGQLWPENQHQAEHNELPEPFVEGWHVYALDWREGKLEWSVDGHVFFSRSAEDWNTATVEKDSNPNAPFDQPFHLMLNLAVGGNLPDNRNEMTFNPSSFPAQMQVDWVRVYR